MLKSLLIIILWIVLIGFIIWSVFFTSLLENMKLITISINHEFISFLPRQIRVVISIIIFGIWVQVYKKFRD